MEFLKNMKEKLFENVEGNQFKLIEEGFSEDKREVQIAKEIISIADSSDRYGKRIIILAKELIDLHTGKAVTKPGTGGVSYKPGSIY